MSLVGNYEINVAVCCRANEERHVEAFMAESWLDYLRQLDRMTDADHITEDHARSFHQGSASPTVTPIIAEHPDWHSAPG